MTDTRPIIIAIMGPTASGKTAAALDIAQKIPSEIISVDSALVYREIYIFRNGFSVIIEAHIEALDFCGVVREEHRTMVNLFADIAFVLGLQIAAPENGILELLAGCLKQLNSFCV